MPLLSEVEVPDGDPQAKEKDDDPTGSIPSTPPQPYGGEALEEDELDTLQALVDDLDLEAYLGEDPLCMAVYRSICREPMSYQVSHYS